MQQTVSNLQLPPYQHNRYLSLRGIVTKACAFTNFRIDILCRFKRVEY